MLAVEIPEGRRINVRLNGKAAARPFSLIVLIVDNAYWRKLLERYRSIEHH